jgi:hypothetical protein
MRKASFRLVRERRSLLAGSNAFTEPSLILPSSARWQENLEAKKRQASGGGAETRRMPKPSRLELFDKFQVDGDVDETFITCLS